MKMHRAQRHFLDSFVRFSLVQTARQRKKWSLREVSRDEALSKPGTVPGESILLDHHGIAEEFQVSSVAARWAQPALGCLGRAQGELTHALGCGSGMKRLKDGFAHFLKYP